MEERQVYGTATMLKRFLNILSLLCTMYLIVLVGVIIVGGVSNWTIFLSSNFLPLMGAYFSIAAINYVAYGRATIWHRHAGRER